MRHPRSTYILHIHMHRYGYIYWGTKMNISHFQVYSNSLTVLNCSTLISNELIVIVLILLIQYQLSLYFILLSILNTQYYLNFICTMALINYITVYLLCVCACTCVPQYTCCQRIKCGSWFSPSTICGSQGSSSSCQAWWQIPLLTKSFSQPRFLSHQVAQLLLTLF